MRIRNIWAGRIVIWNNLSGSGSEFEAGSDLRRINALSVYFGMRKREEWGAV
jgi:hypothetical protein